MPKKIQGVIQTVRRPVNSAIQWLIGQAKTLAKAVMGKVKGSKAEPANADADSLEAERPTVKVPFVIAGHSHELTLQPNGDDIRILMASSVQLPFTTKFNQVHNSIEFFKQYMNTIEVLEVKSEFQKQFPKILELQSIQLEEFRELYRTYFPKGRHALSNDGDPAQAKVGGLVTQANGLLEGLKSWAATTGIDDFSKEAIDTTIKEKGKEAWQTAKKDVDSIVARHSFRGAPVQYTGSLQKGFRAQHTESKVRWNPDDFDIDLYVVHPEAFDEAIRQGKRERNGKIFPPVGDPEFDGLSENVSNALSMTFPLILRVSASAIALKAS